MDPRKADERVVEYLEKARAAHFTWLRSVLTMASGVLAVLVALHRERSATLEEHWLFILAIGSLGTGILFGAIASSSEASGRADQARTILLSQMRKALGNEEGGRMQLVPPRPWAAWCERAAYTMLCCAVFALIAYAIASDRPVAMG